MELITIIIISLGLSMDCFGIAVINGMAPEELRPGTKLKVSLSFALAHVIMLFAGFHLGKGVTSIFIEADYWFALAILSFIGLKMIINSLKTNPMIKAFDVNNIRTIAGLSVATSIDALIAGVCLPFLYIRVEPASFFVALIVLIMTFIGLHKGKNLGLSIGKFSGAIGGALLIAAGIANILYHYLS